MNLRMLTGLSTLLMPMALYATTSPHNSSYTRTYASARAGRSQIHDNKALPLDATRFAGKTTDRITATDNQPRLFTAARTTQLVILDAAVPEKSVFYRDIRPGVAVVELDAQRDGLTQLTNILGQYHNLDAVHVISHASAGRIQLGNTQVSADTIRQQTRVFAAINGSMHDGADLLFYGCDLAADDTGEALLDVIKSNTHVDVAASANKTGNPEHGGDWQLEIARGDIEASIPVGSAALKDFTDVLATYSPRDFCNASTGGKYQTGLTSITSQDGAYLVTTSPTPFMCGYNGPVGYMSGNHDIIIKKPNSATFQLTSIWLGGGCSNVNAYAIKGGSTVASSLNNATVSYNNNINMTNLTGVSMDQVTLKLTGCSGMMGVFGFTPGSPPPPAPAVTDGKISISGASGTGGAYKIGDTVTATWNNTAAGDNNSGITGVKMNFSQFGGGSAVTATNSSDTWTATYTIVAGAIDTTNRNVSVTATNAGGSTTTADTTNATVDNIAPTVTDGNISISGASGTGGAYKIGDTITASWNNTAAGDNNSDTISGVTVDFSQFGGGSAVSASNSSGNWTATYTITAGAIDGTNRNVAVKATDNAGNTTTTADTTNATADNIAPSVSSIVLSGSPASTDTSIAYTVNFSESVSNVSTDDFKLTSTGSAAGTIASVSAASGSSINVTVNNITGNGSLRLDLKSGTNIVDDVSNSIAAYSGGATHTVAIPTAPDAPTIGSASAGDAQATVSFSAPANNGGASISSYSVTSNPGGITATGTGSPITVTGLTNGTSYTFTVTATNSAGTSVSSSTSNSVTPKGAQTITFANPGAQNYGTAPTLTATASSGLTVSFSSTTTGVCTITGSTLTFVTAGTCTINADQAGNSIYNAAPTVLRSFTVNAIMPGAPTIGSATAGDAQATVSFSAPGDSGGATISGYTVTSSPGGISATGTGSPITVTSLTNGTSYTFTVTATNSAGTGSVSAASNAVTPKGAQTITFANPGTQDYGTAPTLMATASSGLTVSFSSTTTGVCTITASGTLTFMTAGTCTINADQAGDSVYSAAPTVSRSFTVNAVMPGAPTIGTATAGDAQATVSFSAPGDSGGATISGYTVTSSPGGISATGTGSPITVTGLTNGTSYTFTVTATNSAGTGSASAASNAVTPAGTQVITFNNPGSQDFGTSPTLTASADSGLTPVFSSTTPSVCTITVGGTLTFLTIGTCTIDVDQAGNAAFQPATTVSQSFSVLAVVPAAPVMGAASAGDASATVSFTAPGFTGGVPITGYTVTSNPGNIMVSGTASPISVTGLTNGTSYTFTVTATNSVGTGPASAASNAVTPLLDTDGDGLPDVTDPLPLDAYHLDIENGSLRNERFGSAVALADMNGDGFADLLVGAPNRAALVSSVMKPNVGAIDIFSGKSGQLLSTFTGDSKREHFGAALAIVADQNTDGIPDIVVGDPDANGVGNVSLYSGADGSLLRSLVDGENSAACSNCWGSSASNGEGFGSAVAIGDVDHDGNPDLIVGVPRAAANGNLAEAGKVVVYQGLSNVPRYTRYGDQAHEHFGAAVAVNSARQWLLVGSPGYNVPAPDKRGNAGRVQVFDSSSGSNPAQLAVTGQSDKEYFGSALASFDMDINSDSAADWAVGAPGANTVGKNTGRVYLFSGAGASPVLTIDGDLAKARFGGALASLADVNRDGISDLAVGSPTRAITDATSGKKRRKAGQVTTLSGTRLH